MSFRFGFVADAAVVSRMLDIEARGATFSLEEDEHFRVTPPTVLTDDDRAFLRQRKPEALAVVRYLNSSEWIGWRPM